MIGVSILSRSSDLGVKSAPLDCRPNLGMAGSDPENLFTRRDGSQKGRSRRHAPLLRGMKWRKSGFARLSAGGEWIRTSSSADAVSSVRTSAHGLDVRFGMTTSLVMVKFEGRCEC